jgi:predicted adenylyl cyclase CyaB
MASNIEIKARVRNPEAVHKTVFRLSGSDGELIEQEDTFFHVPRGRLKLRVFPAGSGELIYYERKDETGPTRSDYFIAPTAEPESLKAALAAALGVRGVVRKKRWLYRVGQTRVHLDEVDGLGPFLELEVVLRPGQPGAEGEKIAADLMRQLDIRDEDLIDLAYIDLLVPNSPAKHTKGHE